MNTEQIQKKIERMLEEAQHTFWGYLGCELVEWNEHRAIVTLDVKEHHLNFIGILHGGVHTSLLDTAMGLTAMTARPDSDVVTSGLNMHFTAPAGKGKVTAVAEIVHMSARTITTQATLKNENNILCSMATASFRVIDKK
ncbi:PaaI family thioesterase [Paenibacillus naphthalenovorans]|uniref:HotDog domain-containing protein n=1 Tax=Paenibacillus naphthalenovorans TaxID=162209 RepID=A0A0U2UCH7_9BACL|nr:PaaI family thioesterase [Paenibacillus naphthalenovorans]ALS23944.1 HotDog domain-containing protein [Paenibacillus naphthalenovorans]